MWCGLFVVGTVLYSLSGEIWQLAHALRIRIAMRIRMDLLFEVLKFNAESIT
jgi:hypothetical protein